MEQTITISLCKLVFKIEEPAYQVLKNYLAAIARQFDDPEEEKEIMTDIEGRIAELLLEKKKDENTIITRSDIDKVIVILGSPDEFAKDQTESQNQKNNSYKDPSHNYDIKNQKRVYRDSDHAVIAGVCNGLAAYFNMDPIIFRVLFIITTIFSGLGLIIYIVLWIVLPVARTPKQKLEMRGNTVNFESIRSSINEESGKVRTNLNNLRQSESMNRTMGVFMEILLVFGLMLKFMLKFVLAVVGFAFLFAGLLLIIVIAGVLFFDLNLHLPAGHISMMSPAELFALFPKFSDSWMLVVAVFLVICIPFLLLIIGGIKMMVGSNFRGGPITVGALVVWALMLILVAALLIPEAKNIEFAQNKNLQEYKIPAITYVQIQLATNKNYESTGISVIPFMGNERYDIYKKSTGDKNIYLGKADLNITRSDNDTINIIVEKKNLSVTHLIDNNSDNRLMYNLTRHDSIVEFDSYFAENHYPIFSGSIVKVDISIPENKQFVFTEQALKDFDSIYFNGVYISKDSLEQTAWSIDSNSFIKESDIKPNEHTLIK